MPKMTLEATIQEAQYVREDSTIVITLTNVRE